VQKNNDARRRKKKPVDRHLTIAHKKQGGFMPPPGIRDGSLPRRISPVSPGYCTLSLPDNESKKFRLTCTPRGNSPGGISPRGLTAGAASQQRNFRRAEKKTFSLKCPLRQPKQDKSPRRLVIYRLN